MQSLPAGSLTNGFLAFDDALIDAIVGGRLTLEQVVALQGSVAAYIANQGDSVNARLIALQDYVVNALNRCSPD